MNADKIDTGALILLRNAKRRLSNQQYKTIRGQILAGDPDGAIRGLRKLLRCREHERL